MKNFLTCLWILGAICLVFGYHHREKELKVEYYSDVSLYCDFDFKENRSINMDDVINMYWIFPDNSLKTGADIVNLDKNKFTVSDEDKPANLTIRDIDDNNFGVYYCIISWKMPPATTTDPGSKLTLIYQGLNVDGPSYDKLIEQYKKNAIVGGIAAAVMLVVVGGSCLLYNLRYSKRHEKRSESIAAYEVNDKVPHDNIAMDMDDHEIPEKIDSANSQL